MKQCKKHDKRNRKKMCIGIIGVLLLIVAIIGAFYKKEEPSMEVQAVSFEATILEVHDTYFLIEPVEGSMERNSASQITVPIKNMDASTEPEAGDMIEVTYDGMIAESYPAQIINVYGIKMIREAIEEVSSEMVIEEDLLVYPLPTTIDLNNIKDCTLAVSIEDGDIIKGDTGTYTMKVKVYEYELFDLVDISFLENGSVEEIVINKKVVKRSSIERNAMGAVIINGGLDVGGYQLVTDGNGVFYSIGYSDVKTYHELGEITLDVAADFAYVDASDLDAGEKKYTLEEVTSSFDYSGTPRNTSIVVEDGVVTSMKKVYVP